MHYETKLFELIEIDIQKTTWNLIGLYIIYSVCTQYTYILSFWQSIPNTCFNVHLATLRDSFIPNFVDNGCPNNDIRAVSGECVRCVCMSGSSDYLIKVMAHFPCTLGFYAIIVVENLLFDNLRWENQWF